MTLKNWYFLPKKEIISKLQANLMLAFVILHIPGTRERLWRVIDGRRPVSLTLDILAIRMTIVAFALEG